MSPGKMKLVHPERQGRATSGLGEAATASGAVAGGPCRDSIWGASGARGSPVFEASQTQSHSPYEEDRAPRLPHRGS